MQLSHNTNQVLQDSPQSTTQLLHQVHMMSHITCPLIHHILSIHFQTRFLHQVMSSSQLQFALSIAQPAVFFALQSVLSIIHLPFTRCIQPVGLFPSSVQHYCPLNNANLHQSTTLVAASYKARKGFLHEYLHLQIHSKISYSDLIMHLKVDKMLSHQQRKGSEEWYNHKILQYDWLTYSLSVA